MLPHVVAHDRPSASSKPPDSLFERVAWVYAFCRERLFRDDTDRIISSLWPSRIPISGDRVIELGCGPGFYSRNLAQRFSNITVTGVDRSERQLLWARQRTEASSIHNCSFERVNVLSLPFPDGSFDALIASRMFTILSEQRRAVEEMFRVLKTGGRCFIAEPRYAFWASIPLFSMWLLASVIHSGNGYCEPTRATVLSRRAFEELFNGLPWKSVRVWRDGRYQYALCEKS
jgi:ubiquinone/menaquinone biosynthesis C-methylase UbiE